MSFSLFRKTNYRCARLITRAYSTSFSMGIMAFGSALRDPIYGIYAYVRYADEIVDTFHDYNKPDLFVRFREETWKAIDERISLNPVLDAFQNVVNTYHIDREVIDAFLDSMEMDLDQRTYNPESYSDYIYGSAEVVGLMCLRVFVNGNEALYRELVGPARSLGAAFQKVNFLRDMKDDFENRGRTYFPGINFSQGFTPDMKAAIETDIQNDFDDALVGIRKLPREAKTGVYMAYLLYVTLFKKLKSASTDDIRQSRIRVPDTEKLALIPLAVFRTRLGTV